LETLAKVAGDFDSALDASPPRDAAAGAFFQGGSIDGSGTVDELVASDARQPSPLTERSSRPKPLRGPRRGRVAHPGHGGGRTRKVTDPSLSTSEGRDPRTPIPAPEEPSYGPLSPRDATALTLLSGKDASILHDPLSRFNEVENSQKEES
jgi:hypothetical protein